MVRPISLKTLSFTHEHYIGRQTLVGKALSFAHELSLSLFLFYQSTALSSRAVDGHQTYFGGSVYVKLQQLV